MRSAPRDIRSGFTLVEVLVVIAITALLAGLILTYSSASRDQVALYVEQARLAQTFSRAKSLTVSIYTQNQPVVPCGYGVSLDYDNDSYSLFSYDAPDCDVITFVDSSFQTEIAFEKLPGNLTFSDPDSDSLGNLLFLPPNPDTRIWIEGSSSTSTRGQVIINSRSGDLSSEVQVSSAGQITF